ncbi:hypothetical protein C8R46DRAFT_1223241 [Mycena filopes]|nr:hypothetical protein C8R46DRAFT_1223241 [Mycena filopes]
MSLAPLMLGGGHVRRRSIGSTFAASPCMRVEKRKHTAYHENPDRARILTKASIASTSSYAQSLEESALVAAGEDMVTPAGPALLAPQPQLPLALLDHHDLELRRRDSASVVDVNVILSNATHPMASTARDRVRARARGQGASSPGFCCAGSCVVVISSKNSSSPTAHQGIFIVNADAGSVDLTPGRGWDDEHGASGLTRLSLGLCYRISCRRKTPRSALADSVAGVKAKLRLSSPEQQRPSPVELNRAFISQHALQALEVRSNVDVPMPASTFAQARPRVASATRRSALGWAKRSAKAWTDLKENNANTSLSGMSFMMTPGESLRISRPGPRGRPTPT